VNFDQPNGRSFIIMPLWLWGLASTKWLVFCQSIERAYWGLMNFKFAHCLSTHKSALIWNFEGFVLCTKPTACYGTHQKFEQQSTMTKVILKMLWKASKNARLKQDKDRAVSTKWRLTEPRSVLVFGMSFEQVFTCLLHMEDAKQMVEENLHWW